MEHWDYLQLQCAMYVTSDLPGVPNHLQSVNIRLFFPVPGFYSHLLYRIYKKSRRGFVSA
jgi:hypothetical protein